MVIVRRRIAPQVSNGRAAEPPGAARGDTHDLSQATRQSPLASNIPTGVLVVLGRIKATCIKPPLQLGWTRQQKLLASGNSTYPAVGADQTSGRCFLCRPPAKWSGLVQHPDQIAASRDLSLVRLHGASDL